MAIAAALGDWRDFFIAQAGAAAVLAGLVFVAVSINLERIMAMRHLPGRALEAIVLLFAVLLESSLVLIPDQSSTTLGAEVLGLAFLFVVGVALVQRDVYRKLEPRYRREYRASMALAQLAVLAFAAGGIVLLVHGSGGLYWTIPGVLLSYFVAITDAWVLLVEIHR